MQEEGEGGGGGGGGARCWGAGKPTIEEIAGISPPAVDAWPRFGCWLAGVGLEPVGGCGRTDMTPRVYGGARPGWPCPDGAGPPRPVVCYSHLSDPRSSEENKVWNIIT